MSTLAWVLAGIVVYTVVALLLKRQGYLPESVGVQGPILTLHTKRGRDFLDWLAGPKRFWRAWSNFGVGIALVVMTGTFLFLALIGVSTLQNPPPQTAVNQPQNFLAIPGVNEFLPLSVAPEIVTGLVVGLIVHEGGHGLLCRVEDIDIESMGLAFVALIPVGAFVEPNEESQKRASRGGKTRMFAAGVTNNFAITIVAYALLFGPVIASIGTAPGVAVGQVVPNSTADDAGIHPGDRITAVNGVAVDDESELTAQLEAAQSETVELEVNGETTKSVTRSLVVVGNVGRTSDVSPGSKVVAVNGTEVHTRRELMAELRDREVASVRTESGDVHTFPAGVFTTVQDGGPLDGSGDFAKNQPLVIVSIDGNRTRTPEELSAVLDRTEPNETVEVVAYANGTRRAYDVTLGESDDGGGYLGVSVYPGVSGLVIEEFGIRPYQSDKYLSALGKDVGGGGDLGPIATFFSQMIVALYLPFADVVPGLGFQFRFFGFAGLNTNFYQATGPLGILGDNVFLLANVLFWVGWINVQLGIFNCIPAFPLDGGHILRTSAETVVSRLPLNATRNMISAITTTVSLTMLMSLLIVIFGPILL